MLSEDNKMIHPEYIVAWMKFVKNYPENKKFLESFWESQIKSKHIMIEHIKNYNPKNIAIFGGWYGIFAQLIECNITSVEKIITVDIDPECFNIFSKIDVGFKVKSLTACMSKFKQYEAIDFVVNTSTEHVEQDIYNSWWENIPEGITYAIQGNNFNNLDEHIRCADSIEHFLEINNVVNPLITKKIDCNGFDRYMAIGIK